MEFKRSWFVVLTLLQLCRADQVISRVWYSASEGYPKPLSELFSTESPFSSERPIVVSQGSTVLDANQYSTLPPPSSPSTSTITTDLPAGALYKTQLGKQNPADPILNQNGSLQPLGPYFLQGVILKKEEPNQISSTQSPTIPNYSVQPVQPQQTGETFTPYLTSSTPFTEQSMTAVYQTPISSPATFSTISPTTYNVVPPSTYSTTPPPTFTPASPRNPLPAYTFQQVPQSYMTSPDITIQPTTPRSPPSPTDFTPSTIKSTTSPLPSTPMRTTSSGVPCSMTTSSVRVTPSSTLGLSTQTNFAKEFQNRPAIPYPLKIRVVAPRGSITNVHFNPIMNVKEKIVSVTKRTTTRKPRTSKPKRNNYDRCLDGCKKVKDPVCAAPLSHVTIEAKVLRGFASVCHMACHNSYRKEPYEKVIDGNCSKLRDRIRLIDSKTRLKKEDLNKNVYSVDNHNTVIEVSGLA